MGFYRREYWCGLPLSSPGDLPNPRDLTLISCISCTGRQIVYCSHDLGSYVRERRDAVASEHPRQIFCLQVRISNTWISKCIERLFFFKDCSVRYWRKHTKTMYTIPFLGRQDACSTLYCEAVSVMRHYKQLLNGGTGFREERNHWSEEAEP